MFYFDLIQSSYMYKLFVLNIELRYRETVALESFNFYVAVFFLALKI